jgi:5-methyltetrahydrofolate--homocysteine methyltransferase
LRRASASLSSASAPTLRIAEVSKLILRVISTGSAVARQQVQGGANLLDVNSGRRDDRLGGGYGSIPNLTGSEPEIARIPPVVDSSKWSVIEAGLKCPGKSVVNSISLKTAKKTFSGKPD